MSYTENSNILVPLATIFLHPTGNGIGDAWAKCEGQILTDTTLGLTTAQQTALGIALKVGDGSAGTHLPNTKGLFVRGVGKNTYTRGNTTALAVQEGAVASHAHSVTWTWAGYYSSGGGGPATIAYEEYQADGDVERTGFTVDNELGSDNRPDNISMYYIIKIK